MTKETLKGENNAMKDIFVKGQFTEAELEKAIITLFEQQGYIYKWRKSAQKI